MKKVLKNGRTALLVRCTKEEAEDIRQTAKAERRTISGFILNAVLHRIQAHRKLNRGGAGI
jgi:uncharacterized protein (DUF1778 family)